MSSIAIRKATSGDAHILYDMLRDKAELEGLSGEFSATPEKLERMFTKNNSTTLIAEYDSIPAGMANYHVEDSTFSGVSLIMLDDLYTMPKYGGLGIAKSLLRQVAREAIEQDYKVKIGPLISNVRPLQWYQKLGARPVYDAKILRIDDVHSFLQSLGEKHAP